ncbi:MAG: hypothetical protein ACJ736_23560 [Streptomyces sp.]
MRKRTAVQGLLITATALVAAAARPRHLPLPAHGLLVRCRRPDRPVGGTGRRQQHTCRIQQARTASALYGSDPAKEG